METPTK
jgi:hypothetical protein